MVPDPCLPTRGDSSPKWALKLATDARLPVPQNPTSPSSRLTPHSLGHSRHPDFGAVIGLSLTLMGMLVMFSRRKVITKALGYLSMENGVLMFGIFVTELPFILEVLIIIDLIILVLLTSILAVGLDSSIEEYRKKIRRLQIWNGGEAL